MNEITLNALINLFALFSSANRIDRKTGSGIFREYIELHLGISASEDYLNLYETLLDLHETSGQDASNGHYGRQVADICNHLKDRMTRAEQVMLFLRFFELGSSGMMPLSGQDLFHQAAEVFGITDDTYRKYQDFISAEPDHLPVSDDFLILGEKQAEGLTAGKFAITAMEGMLIFFRMPETSSIIFKYYGTDKIELEENPIQSGRFYTLKEGGIIRGQKLTPVYYSEIAAAFVDTEKTPLFSFSAEKLEYTFPGGNKGLHPFSFHENSGQMIAIMGGSGVGKSTLLNILNGTILPERGQLFFNGKRITDPGRDMEGLVGYIPQDDMLFEELSIRDNLLFNLRLCDNRLNAEEAEKAVAATLQELDLFEQRNLKVGSPLNKLISGGQRKRLNIALELIREPAILFVDEPTSGLSSTDSEKVMLLLKHQARKGKLVIVNIHQPSSTIYKLFDKLWLLDKGGRCIYAGNPLDAVRYFKETVHHVNPDKYGCRYCGNVSPEKIFDIVEAKKIDSSGSFTAERRISPDEWYQLYRQKITTEDVSGARTHTEIPEPKYRKPGCWKQFLVYSARNLRTKLSDRLYLLIALLQAPLLAVIVSWFTRYSKEGHYLLLENKNLISYIFMSVVVILLTGLTISAEEIIRDRKILQRERFLNLSRSSYLHSKILYLAVLSAIQAWSYVVAGNMIAGIEGLNGQWWLVLFAVAVFANLTGLNISSAFDSVVTIYITIPLILIPQILLCGIIVPFSDLQNKRNPRDAVPIAGDLMVSRWAFEALAVEQYTGNQFNRHFFDVEKKMYNARYRAAILLPELISRNEHAAGRIRKGLSPDSLKSQLLLLQHMVRRLDMEGRTAAFSATDRISASAFSPALSDSLNRHLQKLKSVYEAIAEQQRSQKDSYVRSISKQQEADYLFRLKQQHHNEALEHLVLNNESADFFRETPTALVQTIAPIYKKPDFHNGRAHFLASEKKLGKMTFATFWFNLGVIWLMSLVLYLCLQFDLLRKLLHAFSKSQSR
ncbi:MAG TPA: ATP-binding cassette domain-containing protein [Bacteroidales bacterium]|nr:ATP-binding cassette domain-containing protein [Bacteroidales bacterium]HSA44173.1 ATP-binding cassette domain-containing protein [Bacteroidales bacterium]